MLFFYIRHGRPTYNPDELTPLGKRQAESMAHRLALYGVDKVFASSSNRAIQTAMPTCEICEKKLEILDWCNESYAFAETSAIHPCGDRVWAFVIPEYLRNFVDDSVIKLGDKWYESPLFTKDTTFKKGIERVNRETDAFFASLGYVHDRSKHVYIPEKRNNDRVALFAHEGFGMMFLSSLLDIPYNIFAARFRMSYTGMTVIDFDTRWEDNVVIPRVLSFANDSHLYRDGLPTKFQNYVSF